MGVNMYYYYTVVTAFGKTVIEGLSTAFLWFTRPMSDTFNSLAEMLGITIDTSQLPIIGDLLGVPWLVFVCGVAVYTVIIRAIFKLYM